MIYHLFSTSSCKKTNKLLRRTTVVAVDYSCRSFFFSSSNNLKEQLPVLVNILYVHTRFFEKNIISLVKSTIITSQTKQTVIGIIFSDSDLPISSRVIILLSYSFLKKKFIHYLQYFFLLSNL